jgi:hypothetical protein
MILTSQHEDKPSKPSRSCLCVVCANEQAKGGDKKETAGCTHAHDDEGEIK